MTSLADFEIDDWAEHSLYKPLLLKFVADSVFHARSNYNPLKFILCV